MNVRSAAICSVILLLAISDAIQVRGAIAINQITDINSTPGFAGVNIFANAPIGVDETAVFMNNDIVVYSLIGGGTNNGAGLSIPISNGENGITETAPPGHPEDPPGSPNFDDNNVEAAHSVFSAIGNATNRLENGNVIRFSMWMRQDPNSPVTKQPSVEPVVKIELWKEALSGFADFNGVAFPGAGDRIWDSDQNGGQAVHRNAGQSQASWVDMNNNGAIASGQPVAASLVTHEWRRVETTLVVDDDPLDDGFGWSIGAEQFDVSDVEEIRAVMFVGDFTNTDTLANGGSFWVDNAMIEIFANQAAMLATPNPNTAPVEGLSGDYNNNGTVDAADYVLWRNGGPLQNEVATVGMVTQEDFTEWRARFGNAAAGGGNGAVNTTLVPEPASCLLAMLAALFGLAVRHR